MTRNWETVWAMVHAERRRLAADLTALADSTATSADTHAEAALWATPSLCPGWDVHDVLAHQVDTARTGRRLFIRRMIQARGDFDRANQIGVDRTRQADPRDTVRALLTVADFTKTAPAHRDTRLVEAIVHGEDIRRPLGLAGEYPRWAVYAALEYQLRTAVAFGGGRERAAGLRLLDSTGGTAWGEGPEVPGDAVDLLLAASGRTVPEGRLSGPGADRLVSPQP